MTDSQGCLWQGKADETPAAPHWSISSAVSPFGPGVDGAFADAARLPTPAGVALGDLGPGGAAVASVHPAFWRATDGKAGAVRLEKLSDDDLGDLENRAIARVPASPFHDAGVRMPPAVRSNDGRVLLAAWRAVLEPMFDERSFLSFCGTYSDAYGYAHGVMKLDNATRDYKRFLVRAGELGPGCVGVEVAPTGKLYGRLIPHVHSLIAWDGRECSAEALRAAWSDDRGWAVVKPVGDVAGALRYVTKHMLVRSAVDTFDWWPTLGDPDSLGRVESRVARKLAASSAVAERESRASAALTETSRGGMASGRLSGSDRELLRLRRSMRSAGLV